MAFEALRDTLFTNGDEASLMHLNRCITAGIRGIKVLLATEEDPRNRQCLEIRREGLIAYGNYIYSLCQPPMTPESPCRQCLCEGNRAIVCGCACHHRDMW